MGWLRFHGILHMYFVSLAEYCRTYSPAQWCMQVFPPSTSYLPTISIQIKYSSVLLLDILMIQFFYGYNSTIMTLELPDLMHNFLSSHAYFWGKMLENLWYGSKIFISQKCTFSFKFSIGKVYEKKRNIKIIQKLKEAIIFKIRFEIKKLKM